MDGTKEVLGLRNVSSHCSISEMDDYDLSKLLDKPRLNIERQRSFDERLLSELSIGLTCGGVENYESTYSPGGRSGFDAPVSSTRNSFEPHPMVAEAWEALRRSLVYFRGQPVGTIAAYDHASEEVLNYDQEIMHDPQVAADGFTYEGKAICDWLENGRGTSPMTNLRLSHLHLTPNHALRHAIQDWLCKS